MIKILNLIQAIIAKVNETGYNIYLNEKNIQVSYPFVIVKLPNSTEDENREDFIMEVDIWTKDIIQTIQMTGIVDDKLNGFNFINDYVQFSIYKINQLNNLDDEDKTIKRNQLRYQVKTYFRN